MSGLFRFLRGVIAALSGSGILLLLVLWMLPLTEAAEPSPVYGAMLTNTLTKVGPVVLGLGARSLCTGGKKRRAEEALSDRTYCSLVNPNAMDVCDPDGMSCPCTAPSSGQGPRRSGRSRKPSEKGEKMKKFQHDNYKEKDPDKVRALCLLLFKDAAMPSSVLQLLTPFISLPP